MSYLVNEMPLFLYHTLLGVLKHQGQMLISTI